MIILGKNPSVNKNNLVAVPNKQNQLLKIADILQFLPKFIGQWISWLALFLVLGVFLTVILRYLFHQPSIMLQEADMWLHSMVFMLGIAYTLAVDDHVRVDIFYRGASKKQQLWTDLLGSLFLLLPVAGYLWSNSWHYVMLSWKIGESSAEVGGLSHLYLLKTLLLLLPALLVLQGIAIILKTISQLLNSARSTADTTLPTSKGEM